MPVLAPDGTAARNTPRFVVRSTSTVGFPRESKIWRALSALIKTIVRIEQMLNFNLEINYESFSLHQSQEKVSKKQKMVDRYGQYIVGNL